MTAGRLMSTAALVVCAGCSVLREDAPEPLLATGPRLGDLVSGATGAAQVPTGGHVAAPTAAEVADLYERALADTQIQDSQAPALRRMAVLRLAGAEDALVDGELPGTFEPALAAIKRARTVDPDAALVYLEARALSLSGDESASLDVLAGAIDADPEAPLAVEARFRRAEAAFSANRWALAAEGFEAVAAADSKLALHARYMLGWSRFKASQPGQALDAFVDVIGALAVQQAGKEAAEQTLAPSLIELRADTLRVLVFVISEQGGVAALAAAMDTRGRPDWQLVIYQALADARMRQERYVDTARVLATYVEHNPLAAPAPAMFLRRLDVVRSAGLVASEDETDTLRAQFVADYGRGSAWQIASDAAAFAELAAPLAEFLERLTLLAHARAQDSGAAADWLAAAGWYERRVQNLPDDPAMPQWLMLQAEALEQGGELIAAMAVLENMLAVAPEHERAADAAYALTDLHQRTGSDGLVEAQQRFVERFADDVRAPAVAVALAEGWYANGDLALAAEAAEHALASFALGANERVARELAAAARFELGEHARAMVAYETLLARWPNDPRDYRERLLASTHQQAQLLLAGGDAASADDLLARLVEIDPDAELSMSAQFQRAALAVEQDRLTRATALLADIRSRWPQAAVEHDVNLRLADLYEKSGNLGAAADEFLLIAAATDQPHERRRAAAWRAAEIATELGDDMTAAQRFETYLQAWPQPVDVWVEALAARTSLARAGTGELAPWLERQVQFAERGGAGLSSRARGLAAQAAFELAGTLHQRYDATPLTGNLAASLPRRRDALKAAFAGYERAAALGVLGVSSRAGYEAARLYEQFADALMDSPRPALDADALAEYDLLLEEQAFGFEERAIELHAANLRLLPDAGLDDGMRGSLAALERLYPARYQRKEVEPVALAQLY